MKKGVILASALATALVASPVFAESQDEANARALKALKAWSLTMGVIAGAIAQANQPPPPPAVVIVPQPYPVYMGQPCWPMTIWVETDFGLAPRTVCR